MAKPYHWQIFAFYWFSVEDNFHFKRAGVPTKCDASRMGLTSWPICPPLTRLFPLTASLSATLYSPSCYKYRLLLVQHYILPLNPLLPPHPTPPRPSSVSHTHSVVGESRSDVSHQTYHKEPVAKATAPRVSMATVRHVKVVQAPPAKRGGGGGDNNQ